MADPLIRRVKKWTFLTWCDLRNHPMMLLGAFIGLLVFAILYAQHETTQSRIGGIEHTIKVPRRCQVAKLPKAPPNTVILICSPAQKAEIDRAKKAAAKAAARRAVRRARRNAAKAGGPHRRQRRGSTPPQGNSNGSQGNPSSPTSPPRSSPSPPGAPSSPPSGGGGSSSPPPSQPSRPAPGPGITTPQIGPVPSIHVPLPPVPLPRLPPLPSS